MSGQTIYVPNGLSGINSSSNGSVGIGTSAPQAGLDVYNGIHVHGSAAYASTGAGLEILKISDSLGTISMFNGPDRTERELRFYGAPLSFFTGGTERMRLTSAGAVGIGTSTPGVKLEIANNQPYTVYLSGVAPSLYFGPTSGVFPNGAGNSFSAFLGFSTSGGSYGQGTGDLNIATQSRGTGNSNAINFLIPADNEGNYALAAKITRTGNMGIGTESPSHKLSVNGTIRAKEIIVDTGWADYVFAEDYRLAPLAEVEAHIKEHRHLPGIPSAADVAVEGVSLGEMQTRLLAKVEELTLHLIEQDHRMRDQDRRLEEQQRELASLRAKVAGSQNNE